MEKMIKFQIYNSFSLSILITAELKMNALRERELNNGLEQRLTEEKKLRGKKINNEYFLQFLIFAKLSNIVVLSCVKSLSFEFGETKGIELLIFFSLKPVARISTHLT